MVTAAPSAATQAGINDEALAGLGHALRRVEEPLALRAKLRVLAGLDAEHARREAIRLLSAHLWRQWRPVLLAAGVVAGTANARATASPRGLRTLLTDDSREVWLWVMGDRPFVHLLDGVTGRFLRRLRP
jgi:hypothetical protein